MQWIKKGMKNENGEVQTIANESATRVAQTYKLMDADVDTGYVSKSEVSEVREYRYIWNNV